MGTIKVVESFKAACEDTRKSMLKAAAVSLNQVAFQASQKAKELISTRFIVRNTFTAASVRYTKCPRAATLSDLQSETGILERAGYMALQEEGGSKKGPAGKNLIIPNTRARGGSNRAPVKRVYHYDNMKKNFHPRLVGGAPSRSKMALAVAAKNAAAHRGFIRINDTIMQVTRFSPRRDNRMFTAKPILNLSHKAVNVPQTEWLRPAAEFAAEKLEDLFCKNMDAT